MTALAVRDLKVRYGRAEALRGVSLDIQESEICAVLGANGSGKTTLLRAICGAVPSRGYVSIGGNPVSSRRPDRVCRLGVAHVLQGRGTLADLTVRENLLVGGYTTRDRARVEQRIDEMLRLFPSLAERLSQRAGSLSGGEQQMLAIARALMPSPRLLLLDEPSTGLAPMLVREVFRTLRQIRDAGVSVLVVEQNAALALDSADCGYVLANGLVVQQGSAQELRQDTDLRDAYLGRRVGRE